jgi:hypothetical protein
MRNHEVRLITTIEIFSKLELIRNGYEIEETRPYPKPIWLGKGNTFILEGHRPRNENVFLGHYQSCLSADTAAPVWGSCAVRSID